MDYNVLLLITVSYPAGKPATPTSCNIKVMPVLYFYFMNA